MWVSPRSRGQGRWGRTETEWTYLEQETCKVWVGNVRCEICLQVVLKLHVCAEHSQVTYQKWWCVSFPRSGEQLSLPKQERKHPVFSSLWLNSKWQLPLQHYHAEKLNTQQTVQHYFPGKSAAYTKHVHGHSIFTSPLKPFLLDKCYLYVSYWGGVSMHKSVHSNQKVPKELCSWFGGVAFQSIVYSGDNTLDLQAHTPNQKPQSMVLPLITVLYLICINQLKA